MDIVRGVRNLASRHLGGVVAIGSFDGLHLGHRALIDATREQAARAGRPALMLSFEPLPREFLTPGDPPARLTNLRERVRLLEGSGLDALVLLRFDARLRGMDGDAFVRLLHERLQATGVVVGHDFHFGRGGAADAAFLRGAGARLGFGVEVIGPVAADSARVSSSGIRAALEVRDLAAAARLLGRPYSMRGRVVAGQQLGRTWGFPTANIRMRRRRVPVTGIFAVRVHGIGDGPAARPYGGVASLGTRPTVGGVEPLLEVFVFDYAGDLYGRELEVEFLAHLREELRFESVERLLVQMRADAEAARALLQDIG
ncbi:MAG: bifunctional riboflavin kinase/FAD synthetase [Gammaproteobacteria bacterium]|nr:bifunctional riboflavin kinase/FAD synthetase [Gammaproteobacteria bacterium]